MEISKNTAVTFHYNLFDQAGNQVESSHTGNPSLCLIGANNILPGLEQAMIGKQAGDSFEITLEPHLAYGLRQDNKTDRISIKYLKHEGKLSAGKVVRINTDKGVQTATIIKVGKFNVDVDLNHPLAGQSIRFDIEITDVRAASADEVAHGHAHGVGGHQH
ncbi:MAG: peptidylprolyl isomerase [Spongiibacteraceae bacterium]